MTLIDATCIVSLQRTLTHTLCIHITESNTNMNKEYETKLVKLYIAEYFSVSRWAEDCHITEAEGQRMLDEHSELFSSPSELPYTNTHIQ